jgi:haloacetate dehalogenase
MATRHSLFPGFERHQIETGEVTINCVAGGSGPPVLLLHGYPQNLALWARVAPLLAESFSVVCADLRGYGDSSKPRSAPDASNYSFRAMARDQVAVMRHLGFERFHVVGHDRGGRTAHRMALDHPDAVLSLAVLDIVPTYAMFFETNRHVASAYWHWYFLSVAEPFPERLIASDPDFFYENSIARWGAARLDDFAPEILAEYRRCWNDPGMIHGSCSDYRAAKSIDLVHDEADLAVKVACPALALWGTKGEMHKLFDMEAEWRKKCDRLQTATLPGSHFFVDQFPTESAAILEKFLSEASASSSNA